VIDLLEDAKKDSKSGSHLARLPTLALVGRLCLGVLFAYLGLTKALHPVEFLKLVREYELAASPLVLNFMAATLPWFELFIGLCLMAGIGVRGTGLLAIALLLPFTVAIAQRASWIHEVQGIPFCGIRFDCGCGSGEVLICRKLVENVGLILVATLVVFVHAPYASLRYSLFGESPRSGIPESSGR
jgi:uncharacterized membrane protein YphA (DoxX/SURF4 family)